MALRPFAGSLDQAGFELVSTGGTHRTLAEEAGRLEIECAPWNPADTVGGLDTRDVGVMVDRVTIGE